MEITNIKKLREQKKIKQQEMAKLLGYNVVNYNKIENGERGLPIKRAKEAAKILDCTLDDIFLTSHSPKCPTDI